MKKIIAYGTLDILLIGTSTWGVVPAHRVAGSLSRRRRTGSTAGRTGLHRSTTGAARPCSNRSGMPAKYSRGTTWDREVDDIGHDVAGGFVMGHGWEGKSDSMSERCEVRHLKGSKDVSTSCIKRSTGLGAA